MKAIAALVTTSLMCLGLNSPGQETSAPERWLVRFDMGGTIPQNPTLSLIDGPVTSGGEMDLSAGLAVDFGLGYQVLPWLLIEGELGFLFNEINSVGNWSYPDSSLSQMAMMVNVEFSYPMDALVPYVGIGAGGVYSSVAFGQYYYYYYSDSDGWGSDFVPAAQLFAGVRFKLNRNWTAGLTYRVLATASQEWDVEWEWWNIPDFQIGVDSVIIHSICFSIMASF